MYSRPSSPPSEVRRTPSGRAPMRGARRLVTGVTAVVLLAAMAACEPVGPAEPSRSAEGSASGAAPVQEQPLAPVVPAAPEVPATVAAEEAVPAPEISATTAPEPQVATPAAPPSKAPAVPQPVAATEPPAAARQGTWLSGASGTGVADGSMAAWRGRPMEIAGSWSDNNQDMLYLWQLQPGAEFGSWNLPMDVAIGAIGAGETWAQAAQGAYDARWRQSLTKARDLWAHRPGTLFIRFAHEMNGNWYPWSVEAGEAGDFITAWKRFHDLQEQIYPAAQLVFCVNRESIGTGIDWRQTFPGAAYVDVMGVDYYNQYPYVSDAAGWAASLDDRDQYGSPKGLEAHLAFARENGLPLAVPEWSAKASQGDSPAFVRGMYEFFRAHQGSGSGQLLYEIQFNVDMHGDDYRLFGGGKLPTSAAMYRDLW